MISREEAHFDKKLSLLNVWSLALGCIVGGSAFIMPGTTFLPNAGPVGTAIALFLGAFVMIVIALNYSYMIPKYPTAGGEFTYAKHSFGVTHAFICAWFLELSYVSLVPLNATAVALVGRTLFNNMLQIGFHYTVAGYDVYFGEILFAVMALAAIGYASFLGVKISGAVQTILVISLLSGVGIVTAAAIINPNITLNNLDPIYAPGKGAFEGILAVFAISPWAFVGFDTIPQSVEEFKFSSAKTKLIMIMAILFGALIYITISMVTTAVIPQGYTLWSSYIADLSNLSGLMAMPTFHAAYQLLGNAGLFFVGIAVLAACLTGIAGFLMAASRLLYSMSKVNFVPSWLGIIDQNHKTPKNAIIAILVISLFGPLFGRTALSWIVDMASIGAAIGYGYTSAATIKHAIKEKKTTYIVTGFLGTIFAVIFAFLLLVPIKALNCSLCKEAYICLIIWLLGGGIFFIRLRRGTAILRYDKMSKNRK